VNLNPKSANFSSYASPYSKRPTSPQGAAPTNSVFSQKMPIQQDLSAAFASPGPAQDISSTLYQIISILSLITQSLTQSNQFNQSPSPTAKAPSNPIKNPIPAPTPSDTPTPSSSKSGTSTANEDIDWGAPSTESEDPNGAYQVPGGFEPPKGNEKADADPGITADPGDIQAADSTPDDSKSHSQAAGTKQQHSMAQVDQMYGSIVDKELAKYNAKYGTNCPRQVILGIIYQESQGDPNTFGTDDPAESRGLMQVTADNAAREFPGKNQYNPEVSIETGVEAFTRTLSKNNGNLMQSLASYNQGKPTTSQGKAYAQWVKLWASQVPAQS